MKYLKLFEKQLSLFPEYTKQYSDSLHDVGMKFIKNFSTHTSSQNKSSINNWSDALDFINGNQKHRDAYLKAIKDSLNDDNDMIADMCHNTDIHLFKPDIAKFIKDLNITNKVELTKIADAYKKLSSEDDLQTLFEDLKDINNKIDIADFIEWLIETNPYFFIKNNFIDTTYYYKLREWINEDEHVIWRAIKIPDRIEDLEVYLKKYEGVGECWAYEESGADTYNGDTKVHNTIILKATINPEEIDWEQTLYLSLYSLRNEKEIRLIKGAVVEVTHIFVENKHPDMETLRNRDYDYYQNVLGIDSHQAYKVSKIGMNLNIELEDPIFVKI